MGEQKTLIVLYINRESRPKTRTRETPLAHGHRSAHGDTPLPSARFGCLFVPQTDGRLWLPVMVISPSHTIHAHSSRWIQSRCQHIPVSRERSRAQGHPCFLYDRFLSGSLQVKRSARGPYAACGRTTFASLQTSSITKPPASNTTVLLDLGRKW